MMGIVVTMMVMIVMKIQRCVAGKKKRVRITDPGPVPFFCTDSVDAVVTKLTMLDNVTMVVDDGNKADNV